MRTVRTVRTVRAVVVREDSSKRGCERMREVSMREIGEGDRWRDR